MTRKRAEEFSKLYKAYSEGKTIQVLIPKGSRIQNVTDHIAIDTWWDVEPLKLHEDSNLYKYRIKPEQKLIPFSKEDRFKFKGKWIIDPDGDLNLVIGIREDGIELGSTFVHFETLLKYKFEDGTPCGKYVEE